MSAKQGQHVRLRITGTKYVANSLDLTFHISNTLEDSTTKDTTDSNGLWLEYEKMKYNADGSVTAIVTTGSGDTTGMTLTDIKTQFATEAFAWALMLVDGAQNRVPSGSGANAGIICQGSKMTFSSVEVSGPKDGYAQLTANFQIFGGITVPE
jgi:hypothetical protein